MLTRKDGNKITWEIADDHKHNCVKCRKGKVIEEFVIYGSRYKSKYLRNVKSVLITTEKKMKDAKKVSLKMNGTEMGI